MSVLPDELWSRVLEIGVQESNFSYKDLCCISISCRRLLRLSSDDTLWSLLLSSDFPQNAASASAPIATCKALYKLRFERERQRKLLSHRRAVLRKESQVMEHSRKLREMEGRLGVESDNLKSASEELSNLRKIRQASVALNVWQLEVVRGRQKQVVEQCVVPIESRTHALEMELRLCRHMVAGLNKKEERKRLDKAKEELASMKYHPLRDYALSSTSSRVEEGYDSKRKKLKRCNDGDRLSSPPLRLDSEAFNKFIPICFGYSGQTRPRAAARL